MSNSKLNQFVASGSTAERTAFVPDPPTPASGPDNGYVWWDTDTQTPWFWDAGGAAWVENAGGGGGGGSNAFSALTSSTNTTAAMVVGTGASLSATGSGSITATAVAVGGVTGLGTGVATALAVNVGSAGAFVVNGGALGTPSSGTLTNATGLPVATGISGLGTGVATALAVNVGSAGAFVTFNGALGTPSSGTLTNATGLPVSTGISGFGTGVATFLATPSSANLAAAVTDETGTGSLVFGTAPTLTGPAVISEAVGSSGLTITGATQTSSFPALSITQTWNNAAVSFTASKINITSTASATGSVLADWQVGSARQFAVSKGGWIGSTSGAAVVGMELYTSSALVFSSARFDNTSGVNGRAVNFSSNFGSSRGGILMASDYMLAFSQTASGSGSDGASGADADVFIKRGGAAATTQLGLDVNGAAVSQTLQACNGITGTDKTGGNLTLAAGKGTGAGSVSSFIVQTPSVGSTGTTAQSLATRVTVTEGSVTLSTGTNLLGGANYQQLTEMTAPSAGAADTVRIYAVDNGSGKTQLMALFSSGAAQQIAIQP